GFTRIDAAFEVAQVLLDGLERLGADLAHAIRAAVLGSRTQPRESLHQPRKLQQILPRPARRITRETGEAVGDIGGVTDLAHLAVAHHVDARGHLALHDL